MLVWALDRVSREGSRPRSPSSAGSPAMAPRCGHSRNRGPRRRIRGWPSCSRRCTPGWPPRSPALVRSGPEPGWSAVSGRACRLAGSRARRIRSRGAAVDTWPDGSENGPQQAEAGLSSPRAAFLQSGGQDDWDRASITCSRPAWDVRRRPRPAAGIFASWPDYHRRLTTSTVQEGVTQLPPGRPSSQAPASEKAVARE